MNIKDKINHIILNEFQDDKVDPSLLKVHAFMNPILWTKNKRLKAPVRNKMLRIAETFITFLKLENEPDIKDIIVTGSNANYHYNETSDIDLHIIMNLESVVGGHLNNVQLAKEYMNAKKNEWNNKRNINFYGVKVEVFVEDDTTPRAAGGIFSIVKNEWLYEPASVVFDKKNPEVLKLATRWVKEIKAAMKSDDPVAMRKILGDIYGARKRALNTVEPGDITAEASKENMAFKMVRAKGLLLALSKALDAHKDKELSLSGKITTEGQVNELFEPGIKYANQLNPALWDGDVLKPEVREKLLAIAKEFSIHINVPLKVEDIVFKGSNANYNYTKTSDIDVHLVAKIPSDNHQQKITDKRVIWKTKYSGIKVMGYPVELGVDEPGKKHSSSAVYSLKFNKWVSRPVYAKPKIDKVAIQKLYILWKKQMDAAFETGDIKIIKKAADQIRGIRDKALDGSKGAEFKTENIAFKRLRDTGVFDRVVALVQQEKMNNLSLKKPGLF